MSIATLFGYWMREEEVTQSALGGVCEERTLQSIHQSCPYLLHSFTRLSSDDFGDLFVHAPPAVLLSAFA